MADGHGRRGSERSWRRRPSALVILLIASVACTGDGRRVAPTSATCRAVAEAEPDPALSITDLQRHPWPTAAPEEVGLDGAILEAAADDAGLSGQVASLLVVRHGKLVLERYYNGSTVSESNTVASLSKSILSLLTGQAVELGDLDPDTPIADVLPADLLPRDDGITVRDLLTMSSGLEWDEDQDSDVLTVRGTLDRRRVADAGRTFNYNTGLTHVLSAVLTEATGQSTCDLARTHLFEPLGVTADHWIVRDDGYFTGGDTLWLTPREIAMFGQLVLQRGGWEGERLVPEPWIEASMEPAFEFGCTEDYGGRVAAPGAWGYGYLWWLSEAGGMRIWSAQGFGGQFLIIVPELDLAVVLTHHIVPEIERPPVAGLRLLRFFILPAAGFETSSTLDACPLLDVFRVRPDGSGLEQLTTHGAQEIASSWSPDGSRIAMHSERDLNFEVYTMSTGGGDVRRLTTDYGTDGLARWSPDGTAIAFASDREGTFDIYVAGADGSDPRRVTDESTDEILPTWSADGRTLAYLATPHGKAEGEVRAVDADGSHLRLLYSGPASSADWSPDGTAIAFGATVGGLGHVFVVDLATSSVRDLGPGMLPRWSPDGTQIVASLSERSTLVIITVGDGSRRSIELGVDPAAPFWSPDGRWIAFSASRKT